MEEQKVISLQILMHCAPHTNQIWLQMSIQPFLLWLVYISIRIPALIAHSLVKDKLERILEVVVMTQLLLYHKMHLKVLNKSTKNLNHTNLLILNFHDYRFFRDGI